MRLPTYFLVLSECRTIAELQLCIIRDFLKNGVLLLNNMTCVIERHEQRGVRRRNRQPKGSTIIIKMCIIGALVIIYMWALDK